MRFNTQPHHVTHILVNYTPERMRLHKWFDLQSRDVKRLLLFSDLLLCSLFCLCVRSCLWCVAAAARGESKSRHLSGPGVRVSRWHHMLPASWQLLGLLSFTQGDELLNFICFIWNHSTQTAESPVSDVCSVCSSRWSYLKSQLEIWGQIWDQIFLRLLLISLKSDWSLCSE